MVFMDCVQLNAVIDDCDIDDYTNEMKDCFGIDRVDFIGRIVNPIQGNNCIHFRVHGRTGMSLIDNIELAARGYQVCTKKDYDDIIREYYDNKT